MCSVSLFTKLFLSSADFCSETIQMMQMAFGNECMSKTRIKEWYNRFKGGRTSVDSDFRPGRPSTTKKHWIILSGCDLRLKVIVD